MVVSLHDVAPCTQQIANTIISELARRGVGPQKEGERHGGQNAANRMGGTRART